MLSSPPTPFTHKRLLGAGLALVLAVVGIATVLRPRNVSPLYTDPAVHPTLNARTIVWADLTTGYFHYFPNRQASKLGAASPETQDQLIDAIARSGMTQVFVADSPTIRAVVDRLRPQRKLEASGKIYGHDTFVLAPNARGG